jgi:hypothetical protein
VLKKLEKCFWYIKICARQKWAGFVKTYKILV